LNQQQQQQQQQPMQLIDSINETGLPNEIFSDSIINQNHQQFLINNDSFQTNNKLKNWNSESNLTKTKKLDKLNKSCMNNNNNNNELIDQSYYDYDEDGDVLQFSDHAGLFATPDTNNDQEEEEEEENEEDELDNEHQTNLLTNYDVYQATKTNYKLTYHDNNTELFSLKNKNKFQQNDSLVNSTEDQLIMQQIQSNYEEEEEDQDNKYYYLLKKLEKQQQNHLNESSMLDESQQLNDSIMNWSMKISNYNYTNHYQQQKQQLEYQLLNNNNKSQSPLSALLAEKQYLDIITAQANQQNLIPRSNSSFTKLFLTNRQQQQQLSNKSTTSWGKLKHSKSSSSNIANNNNNNNNNNNAITTSCCSHIDSDDVSQSILNQDELNINFLQSVHINDKQQQVVNNIPSISSSPSLFKLFQNNANKTNDPLVSLLNTSSETTNSSSTNNNKRTTSFSQLRQRSLSSCTIGQTPSPTQISSPQQENIETVINNKTNLVVVVDTSSNNKKKQTQQYINNNNQIDQSMQTSTIVCMLVDRNNSKTSKELMEVATRAARAAVAARKSINLYQTKSSLPDLTFLKDYGDDNLSTKNNTTPPNDSTNNQLKSSLSSANLIKPISDLIKLDELAIKKTIAQQQQQQTPGNSELLKRKTLKSIKRYRQTKQNTEPCNLLTDEQNETNNNKFTSYNTQQIRSNNNRVINTSHSSSSSNSSGANNTSVLTSKQPLKSCLKRKDSTNSSSSSSQQTTTTTTTSSSSAGNSKLSKINSTSSLVINNNNNKTVNLNKKFSIQMFVPYVGYLFTWDKESCNRYAYYKNLERNIRIKQYRKLVNNVEDEDEDEDDDEEDVLEDTSSPHHHHHLNEQSVKSSRSYNDLRVKKSVTFLAHIIESKKSKSISPSSTNTTGTLSTSSSSSSSTTTKQSSPPLLQYNALIAMLKSNSIVTPPPPTSSTPSVPTTAVKLERKNSNNNNNNNNNNENYFKKSQIIDADSISLASLSESPPSEFKFSDDDDYDVNKMDQMFNQAIKLNSLKSFNNTTTTTTTMNNTISSSSSSSSSSTNSSFSNKQQQQQQSQQQNYISNKNPTSNTNKYSKQQQQQLKFNQIELIRNKKKHFHSILLKDTKCKLSLNNIFFLFDLFSSITYSPRILSIYS
jgi:hypothetical protein